MNFFRTETKPEFADVPAEQSEKARAYDLIVAMRADIFGHHDTWSVNRELVINGMTMKAFGKSRNLLTAVSQCHAKYQEALKMGAK